MGKFRDNVVSQAGEKANAQMALIQEIALRAEHGATIASLTTHPLRPRANDQILQHTVRLEWRRLAREGGPLPTFDEVEFRLSSQGGEDGIIWFIFSLIGDGKKRSAEICCGDGLDIPGKCQVARVVPVRQEEQAGTRLPDGGVGQSVR